MSQDTRIREVRAYEVVVPARRDLVEDGGLGAFMDGVPWDRKPICLLEVVTDDGITALGETVRGFALAQLAPLLEQLPGRPMRGISPAPLPEAWREQPLHGLDYLHAVQHWAADALLTQALVNALDIATLDWAGKRADCRAVDLLGGAYREAVPVDFWCARLSPDALRKVVAEACECGFTGLKMKSRLGDPVLEQVRAVKEVGGDDFRLTIDPMWQWMSTQQALPIFRQIEPYAHGLRIEDPFPIDQPEHWHRVRQTTTVPLILHARSLADLRRGIQEGYADEYNCAGRIAEFLTMAHAVEVMGHACWHGSAIEMGVAQAAHLHAAAAARSCVLHSDFVSPIVREHTLITWDWPFRGDQLPLPEGPGLGVELEMPAVRRYLQAEATFGG